MVDIAVLKKRIEEEKADSAFYEEMAENIPCYYHMIMDIAHEEDCHARHLQYVLDRLEANM